MGLLNDIANLLTNHHPQTLVLNSHAGAPGTSDGALPPAVVAGKRPDGSFGPMSYKSTVPEGSVQSAQSAQFGPGQLPPQIIQPKFLKGIPRQATFSLPPQNAPVVQGAFNPGYIPMQGSQFTRYAPIQNGYDQTIQY